ncbi:MAG: zf-HC2 domain-containing protein [Acidobacteria bacterium]|nr:zf-HC2 domain-containing protein [Acidobacteriota bacterium]
MSDKSECPSTETLAAFVDGCLRGRERRAVTGHLADCGRCREVVSETVRFSAEAAGSLPSPVVAFPGARRRFNARRVLAAAALLAGAAWLGVRWFGPGTVPAPVTPAPLAAAKPAAPDLSHSALPPALPPTPGSSPAEREPAAPGPAGFYADTLARLATGPAGKTGPAPETGEPSGAAGFAFGGGITRERAAARIGDGLVDLALARRSGATAAAGQIRERLEPAVSVLTNAESLREALSALVAEKSPARLGARLEAVGRALGPAEEPLCRLGFWVRGGLLAVATRDRVFFGPGLPVSLETGVVIPRLPPGAVKTLEAIRTSLEGGFESETDWRRLEKQLKDLRLVVQGGS